MGGKLQDLSQSENCSKLKYFPKLSLFLGFMIFTKLRVYLT